MSNPEEQPDVGAICPYLGLADDADSHATYATEAHRCYRLPNPTRIATGHQETYCLDANHTTCPVYQGEGVPGASRGAAAAAGGATAATEESAPAGRRSARAPATAGTVPGPKSGQRRPQGRAAQRPRQPGTLGPRPRSGGISMPVATIGLFAFAIALVALAIIIQRALSDDDGGAQAGGESFQTVQAARTQTAQAGGVGGDETPDPGTTETPGGEETPTPGGEETATPGDGEPTEEPGNGGGATTYTVESGDTCGAIADQFGLTSQDIIDANPDINEDCTNLQPGQEVTIPAS